MRSDWRTATDDNGEFYSFQFICDLEEIIGTHLHLSMAREYICHAKFGDKIYTHEENEPLFQLINYL